MENIYMSVAIPGSDRLIKVNYLTCKKMKEKCWIYKLKK